MSAKILYIEDNAQNMRLVRKILVHAGYTVLEADTGNGGLEMVNKELPDLVLMDINLPDMDGLEVMSILKKQQHLAHIPIIALTANAMVGDREKMLSAGCNGYLPKPIARQELLDTVAGFLTAK